MFVDPAQLRRAQDEEVRERVLAAPSTRWNVDGDTLDGVGFELHSSLDLGSLRGGALRGVPALEHAAFDRPARVWAAGEFRRTDGVGKGAGVRGLEHPKLGAVYVDDADRTYLHFSPEQLIVGGHPDTLAKAELSCELTTGQRSAVLRVRGIASLDLDIRLAATTSAPAARAMLSSALPGLAELDRIGVPFVKLVAAGVPEAIDVWEVDPRGTRAALVAQHRFSVVKIGPLDADVFRIPAGFRSLRDNRRSTDEQEWRPLVRAKSRPRGTRRTAYPASYHAAYQAAPGLGQFVPPIRVSTEPALPSCQPSTLHVSAALQIQQSLLDAVQHVTNVVSSRLTSFAGARVAPGDPDNTDVALTIDWLDQFAAFSDNQPAGDAVFCLLRDPPPDDDPLGGGTGLLDRFAETLARALLAADDPLPLGGADPVLLEVAVQNEIAAVAADDSIEPDARFGALAAATRAAVREAVLEQRIATINHQFDGNFGEHVWPMPEFDLVHATLQLEDFAVNVNRRLLLTGLNITVADNGRPAIAFTISLEGIEATIRMQRWPGLWFWVLAPAALVAVGIGGAAIGAAAAAALVVTLIGLGPLGLLLLSTLLSAAPLAVLAQVAGGALLLSAVTYLVWDATQLRVELSNAVVRSSVSPTAAQDPDEVVLAAGATTMEGEIMASVTSEIPSGIHQLFDWIANAAIEHFDAEVRDLLEDIVAGGIGSGVRQLPHLRLPQPSRITVGLPLTGPGGEQASIDRTAPRHDLLGLLANGAEEVFLAVAAGTTMQWPFESLRPYLTQVSVDDREPLAALVGATEGRGATVLGYALSQNLLNGQVFARWLSGRLAVDYGDDRIAAAFRTLQAACPRCTPVTDARDVHVWAAGPPRVLVSPRAFDEDPRRPYLLAQLPDVRLCLSGVAAKPSSLEFQFAITAIAHVAFGAANDRGNARTLFTVEDNFLDVRYDERRDFWSLSPVETQGVVPTGPGFDAIAGMDPAERTQFLLDVQPLLEIAAGRLLGRNGVGALTFGIDGTVLSRQLYDDMVAVDFAPRGTTVYATFSLNGPVTLVLPSRDGTGNFVAPLVPLDQQDCEAGRAYRGG